MSTELMRSTRLEGFICRSPCVSVTFRFDTLDAVLQADLETREATRQRLVASSHCQELPCQPEAAADLRSSGDDGGLPKARSGGSGSGDRNANTTLGGAATGASIQELGGGGGGGVGGGGGEAAGIAGASGEAAADGSSTMHAAGNGGKGPNLRTDEPHSRQLKGIWKNPALAGIVLRDDSDEGWRGNVLTFTSGGGQLRLSRDEVISFISPQCHCAMS